MIPMVKSCELLILSMIFLYVPVKCIDPTASPKGKCQTLPRTTFTVTAESQSTSEVMITWDLSEYDVRNWDIHVYADQQHHHTSVNSETKIHMLRDLNPGVTYTIVLYGQPTKGPCIQAIPVNVTLDQATNPRLIQLDSTVAQIDTTERSNIDVTGSNFWRPTFPSLRRLNNNATNNGKLLELENVTIKYETAAQEAINIWDVLKIALYTFCTTLGLMLLLIFIFHIAQHTTKTSDKFTLRRNSKRESAKKLVPHDADVTKNVATERVVQAENLQPPALLKIPNANQRNTVCSITSWGSEFELPEQGDSIYSNATCQPSYATCPRPQRNQPTGQHTDFVCSTMPNSTKINFPRHNVTSGTTDCGLNAVIPPQTDARDEQGIYDNVSAVPDPCAIYANS